jgi:hypothetical protein
MQTPSHIIRQITLYALIFGWEQNETVAVYLWLFTAFSSTGPKVMAEHRLVSALSKQWGCVYRFSSIYTITYSSLSLIFN